ncbi:MAG: hypothetical protein D6762_08400 [Candidatus Neomarinimicrobiota bacterium]|nr:MAG: hypothetical protein D6762_08400 [Candidatus Neomarinimicrobiota bacterium]
MERNKTSLTFSRSDTLSWLGAATPERQVTGDFGPLALFRGKHFTLATFGLFIGAGFFLATLHTWFYLGSTGNRYPPRQLAWLVLSLSGGIPVGAWLMSRILDLPRLLRGEIRVSRFLRIPGFALWGGLMSGTLIILFVTNSFHWQLLPILDAVVLGLPLAQALGRLGCLNYGCCHGRECTHGPSITYHNPEAKVLRTYTHLKGIPLFPTQIYSAAANSLIYLVLSAMVYAFHPPVGLAAALYLLLYGAKRFGMEFLRGEYPRTGFLSLTLWQWFSLGFIFAGLVLITSLNPQVTIPFPDWEQGWMMLRALLPYSIVAALVVTGAYSLHGPKVGRW